MKVKKFKIPFAHFGLHARTQSRNLAIHFILFLKCKKFVDKKTQKKKKKLIFSHFELKKKPNSLNLAQKKKAVN